MNKVFFNLNKLVFLNDSEKVTLSPIISKYVGIINAIMERDMLADYNLYVFQSLSQNVSKIFSLCDREVSSGGLGVNKNRRDAFFACLGETVERYCMSFFKMSSLKKLNYEDIPAKFKPNKKDLDLYGNQKIPKGFLSAVYDLIFWTEIKSFESNKIIYWPAALVYLPFSLEKISENTSTGVATHTTINEAVLSGLLEIIERDSQMIRHYTNIICNTINLDTIRDSEVVLLVKKIRKDFNLAVFVLPNTFSVPTFGAYIWQKNKNGFHFGIGASSNLSSDIAIKKALVEALFTFNYSKDIIDLRISDPNKIEKLYEHFLFYQGQNFELLLKQLSKNTIKYKRNIITKNVLLTRLKKAGFSIYYKDITTEDVRGLGFVVVKVIVPGMIDLNKTHKFIKFGQFKNRGLNVTISNKLPHPFP